MAFILSEADALLIESAKNGDNEGVLRALAQGADVHAKDREDSKGDEALWKASWYDHPETVKLLLDHHADMRSRNYADLRYSAEAGRIEVVKILLEYGADVHASDDAAIWYAGITPQKEIIQLLLDHGANPHVGRRQEMGSSCETDEHEESYKLLLRHGANHIGALKEQKWLGQMADAAKRVFERGVTERACFQDGKLTDAVLDACATGTFGALIATPLLLSKKPEDRALFKRIWEALPKSAGTNYTADMGRWYTSGGRQHIEEFLSAPDTDIHANDEYALRWAAANRYKDTVKLLLDKGADIHARGDEALRWAVESGDAGVVKVLLNHRDPANIHARDDEALRLAAEYGYPALVKLLLAHGANIHADNDYALKWAIQYEHIEIIKLLLNHHDPANVHIEDDMPLKWAVDNYHPDIVKLLLEKGANVHSRDDLALWSAAENGYADIVKLLLENPDPANVHMQDDNPLRSAARKGHTGIVEMLLQHRFPADIHAKDDDALCVAASYNHTDTVKLLLAYGADIHAGHDASLESAKINKNDAMGKLLLRYGADDDGSAKVRTWLAQMSTKSQQKFAAGVSENLCFTGKLLSDAVRDACATGQFGTLVGAPLLTSKKPEDRALFARVWEALPECWQAGNRSLHMQFSKSNRAAAVGK